LSPSHPEICVGRKTLREQNGLASKHSDPDVIAAESEEDLEAAFASIRRYDGNPLRAIFSICSQKRRGTTPLSLNGGREQTRALIPLKLALHELHPDQGRRTQCLGLAREFGQTGVIRMLVDAFHARTSRMGVKDQTAEMKAG
jgi:hypothetical protein